MFSARLTAALLAAATFIMSVPLTASAKNTDTKPGRIVGYLPEWHYQYFDKLDLSEVTHINIAFCNPDSSGRISCGIPDSELTRIVSEAHESGVEVFVAFGGGGGCSGYLEHLDTPEEMADFDAEIMQYCEKFGFDGIDLDIELGSSDRIWNYYADWCTELRGLCDERDMQMSTATAAWVAYNISPETFALFDFVNVMAYDNDEDPVSHSTYEYAQVCLDYFSSRKKIPAEKLVLGVPFYGRGYDSNGRLDWDSAASFAEILRNGEEYYALDNCNGMAYNGAVTIAEKAKLSSRYGGIMIWELSHDADGDKSLLKVINDTMRGKKSVTGDVNGDGEFNIADVAAFQKWLLNPVNELKNGKAADLTEDGRLNVFDLCLMKRMLFAGK